MKKQISDMKIPPFGKKHSSSTSSSNKNNNSTRSINTTQTEEVGLHSSYIQSQIQIQKERGNWHVDLTNVLQDDDDNEELRRHSSDQAINSEDDCSDEEEIGIASELQRVGNNTSGSDGRSKSEYITSTATITAEDTTIIPKRNRSNPSLRSNPLSNSLTTATKRGNKAPNVMKRCLSDISLVDMLKIQSIDEKNEFKNDDINHLDLEETVLLKQQSSGSKEISLTESEVDKIESLCNSEREEDDEASNSSEEEDGWKAVGTTAALIPSPLEKRVLVDPLRGGGTKLEDEEEEVISPKSLELDTSFAPPPAINSQQEANNGMGERRGSFLPTPFPIPQEGEVGYEYTAPIIDNSSPTEDDDDTARPNLLSRRNSNRSKQTSEKSDDTFFMQSINSRDNITHASSANDNVDGDYDHYSISSDDGERDTNGENRVEQVRLTNNSTSRHETNPSPSSDESSIDLAFATDRKETEKEDKWEDIRLQRQRRRSSQSGSTTAPKQPKRQSVSTVAATVGSDYSAFEAASPSTRYKPRTQSNSQHKNEQEDSDDDDDISVSSSGSSYSIVSGMKSRFEQFYNNNFGSTFKGVSTKSLYGASRDPLDVSQTSNYTNESMRTDDDDSDSSDSDDDDEGLPNDILSEGEYYVAMSMLIYIYALLRETSLLGHTDIDFDEVDVNSFQSDPGFFSGSHHSTTKFLDKTKSSGFIIRVVMDELEKKEAFSSVEKSDMCVLKEFKQWVNDSRSKQLDAATEQTIKDLRSKIARRRWKRAINAVRLMVRLGHSDSNKFSVQLTTKRRESLRMGGINSHRPYSRRTLGGLGEVGNDGLPQRETAQSSRPRVKLRALAGSMMWMHNQREAIMNNFGITNQSESQDSLTQAQKRNSLVDKNEIKEIINDALEEPRFFIEGSLLSNLIESGIEVVWFGDRHPNDVVYAICVNRQSKRVSVVFRGTVTSHNWMMNLKLQLSEHPNPITEDYPGRAETLGLHTGFSLYMTRQRKDDSLTKIEEIFSNIDSIGRELAPDGDYELSITGHSLGGALATILSFYAATSNIFSRVKAIKVFTYAAPRVGCQRFLYAYQHLEKIGKLRHARFTNTRDFVPLVPFHGVTRSYKHVGMHIKLLGTDKIAQYWLRQALDVTYPRYHDGLSQLLRIWQVNVIRNINTPRGYKRNHTLTEYQRRIRFSIQYRSMLAQAQGSMVCTKRSRLKTLDEYYYIKGACQMSGTGELTRIALENRAKEGVRREARKKLLVLLAIVILEAIILLGVLSHSVPCENYPMALYPLLLLTGCRKGESKEVCVVPDDLQFDKKNQSLAEQVNSLLNNNSNTTRQSSKTKSSNSETTKASRPEERRSWTSLLADWLWTWKPHRHSRDDVPPCVWGRCDNNYLPWGVMPRSLVLPLSIGDSSNTKDSSDMNED